MAFHPIAIPTNSSFLRQWHNWIHQKVSRHFVRDRDRVSDTAQNVRLRLLGKDFIGRWFYKHLSDELVDLQQAEMILGNRQVTFIGSIKPVFLGPNPLCKGKKCQKNGCVRSCKQSLWRISDLLAFAKFDYYRYYYSVQNHTIDSETVLKLLGEPVQKFGILESLYRQGRLKPAELTEHECIEEVAPPPTEKTAICIEPECGRKHLSRGYCNRHYGNHVIVRCQECEHGRKLLRDRGVSLADRWEDPKVAVAVARLRWNDRQLKPFLREYKDKNSVRCSPLYIMRKSPKHGVDAGLLRYAEMVIDHEVVNDFKRITRADDASVNFFNNGVSPEHSDDDSVAWEGEEESEEGLQRVLKDTSSMNKYRRVEDRIDVEAILSAGDLTTEEIDAVAAVDVDEMTAREYSKSVGMPLPKVHRVRSSAMKKLRSIEMPVNAEEKVSEVCTRWGCSLADILGPAVFGNPVRARTDLFSSLYDNGMTVPAIVTEFGVAELLVVAAINRRTLSEMSVSSGE